MGRKKRRGRGSPSLFAPNLTFVHAAGADLGKVGTGGEQNSQILSLEDVWIRPCNKHICDIPILQWLIHKLQVLILDGYLAIGYHNPSFIGRYIVYL